MVDDTLSDTSNLLNLIRIVYFTKQCVFMKIQGRLKIK